ncbi:MAG: hypothetical protein OEM67_06870 [Thermoleophilia bacterium]|nr:hypothetical protein [Thermoleophilia bacterium]MDH3725467.1 hypothetical protein [Thermoleophilia bacterium]
MSERENADAGPFWSVALPERAEPPFEVFVNSVQQAEGTDYVLEGRWLRFRRPLTVMPRLSSWQKLVLSLGIGVYKDLRADTIDLQYMVDGKVRSASGLTVIAPQEPLQAE